jgi:hypothetical protein
VVPVVIVINDGDTATDTPFRELVPLIGAEAAPPQLSSPPTASNRTKTPNERCRTLDIKAPNGITLSLIGRESVLGLDGKFGQVAAFCQKF